MIDNAVSTLNKLAEKIAAIEKEDTENTRKIEAQIDAVKSNLDGVNDKIEESFVSGDAEEGQKLTEQKAQLESKLSYLETFASRRRNLPAISEDDSSKYKKEINNQLLHITAREKKRVDEIVRELERISDNLQNSIQVAQNSGNLVIKLSKSNQPYYGIDPWVTTLYQCISRFVHYYKDNTRPWLEANNK